MNNIYLIGIMGCGKTTVGMETAKILSAHFYDVDRDIERNMGLPVSEIFKEKNEDFFREIETEALYRLSDMQDTIISTGGGIVLHPENVAVMKKTGKIVWIKRPIELILQNIDAEVRPLIKGNPEKLIEIYEKREPLYEQSADAFVMNDRTILEAAQEIADYYLNLEK